MSSTIKAAILALKSRIADAYTAISNKGGTLPQTQDSANLATAIASIPSGGTIKTKIMNINSIGSLYYGNTDVELHEEVLDFNGKVFGTWNNEQLFRGCANVKKIDVSGWNCTLGRYATVFFYGDAALEELYMNGTFAIASSDAAIPMGNWFFGCTALKTLRVGNWLTRVSGFDISMTAMDRDALVQLFNDIGTAYDNTMVITIGAAKLALLSADDIAIATNKGWTLA